LLNRIAAIAKNDVPKSEILGKTIAPSDPGRFLIFDITF
jgi:hypothetical protein